MDVCIFLSNRILIIYFKKKNVLLGQYYISYEFCRIVCFAKMVPYGKKKFLFLIKLKASRLILFTDSNPCTNQPCLNGATCLVNGTSYICSCPTGYFGNNCQICNSSNTLIKFDLQTTFFDRDLFEKQNIRP